MPRATDMLLRAYWNRWAAFAAMALWTAEVHAIKTKVSREALEHPAAVLITAQASKNPRAAYGCGVLL